MDGGPEKNGLINYRYRGGSRYFDGGTKMFLRDLKDSKKGSSENTKIPPSTINYAKIFNIFKNILNLIGFTYVLKMSGFQRFINMPPSYFPCLFKTLGDTNSFGPIRKIVFESSRSRAFQHFRNFGFPEY